LSGFEPETLASQVVSYLQQNPRPFGKGIGGLAQDLEATLGEETGPFWVRDDRQIDAEEPLSHQLSQLRQIAIAARLHFDATFLVVQRPDREFG